MAKRIPVSVLGILLVLAAADASRAEGALVPKAELTLREAVETALSSNNGIKQVKYLGDMEAAKKSEAESMAYPRLYLDTSAMAGNNPVFVFGSLLEQSRFGADRFQIDKLNDPNPVTNWRTNVNLGVPLYDAGQREVMAAMAEQGVAGANARREMAAQEIGVAVVKAYFGVLMAREREEVTAESIKSAEADLKRAKDLQETGMLVKADLLSLEVQLADMNQQVIEARSEREIARASLNMLLGYPEDAAPRLTTPLVSKKFDLPEETSVSAKARTDRPETAVADTEVKKAGEGVKNAGNQYLPRVEAFGNYGFSAATVGDGSTDWTVGVRLTLPLMDFGRSSRTDQALAAESAAKAARTLEGDRVSLEATTAYRRLKAAEERLNVARGAVEQAKEAYRIGADRYQVGLTNVTEVLRAQNAVLRARLGEAGARYSVYAGYAEFLRATGNLKDFTAFE